jgi:hypothetical protein
MTSPSAAAPAAPTPAPDRTHPCARCGAPVPVDVGLCERCNPLGLQDVASSQVHGTVFVAIVVAIVALAIAARVAVSGIGPFKAAIASVEQEAGGLAVTVAVTNEGSAAGTANCRISDPTSRSADRPTFVLSPRVAPGETRTFVHHSTVLGTEPRSLVVECYGP